MEGDNKNTIISNEQAMLTGQPAQFNTISKELFASIACVQRVMCQITAKSMELTGSAFTTIKFEWKDFMGIQVYPKEVRIASLGRKSWPKSSCFLLC
jgi:hypothetical protein